ncbi:MAG: hypothetical protein RL095_158 [Verrucomicrobiota bacterium]|jgi:C-terminal processing protease CtpA/Prc
MGVSSRGGSGGSYTTQLPRSGIAFKLSTIASFKPNGQTFDGYGVEVDIPARPKPRDY